MISHKHKFIYSHIPKAAGTTIEQVLRPHAANTGDPYNLKWLRNKKLFDMYESHPEYYKFSITRNPWDRMVSNYFYFTRRKDIPTTCTFSDFLKEVNTFLMNQDNVFNLYRNVDTNRCVSDLDDPNISLPCESRILGYHVLPQLYFITDQFDYIGKFESLQQDFNTVCDKIGIPRQQLPHKNKSKHKHYTEYYDEETKQIVAEKYAKDIEYFGYEFGE